MSRSEGDSSILEEVCRGVYQPHPGETVETVLTSLFATYGGGIHTDFEFHRGRSPMAYAAMFGQKEVLRVLIEKCGGTLGDVDKVSVDRTSVVLSNIAFRLPSAEQLQRHPRSLYRWTPAPSANAS